MFSRLVAGILLICLLPLIFVVGFIIKLTHPGPVFFWQLREGKNGRQFWVWKLRTMVADADAKLALLIQNDGALAEEWRIYGGFKKDPRIAGNIGKLARQLSIDEIPQLVNILMGDMAFVGPRPLEMCLAEALNPIYRAVRNSVKPGLTGLWQIGRRSDISIRQMQHYDRLYVFKRSLCLDTYIVFKTVSVVLNKTGV